MELKVAGVGFGGSLSRAVTVSASYPGVKGSQQVTAPAYLEARRYRNHYTRETVYRVRIKSIGTPSHIDLFSPYFTEPIGKRWSRDGTFGSTISNGTHHIYDVLKKASFSAAIPIKTKSATLNIGYTVSKSSSLKLQATALSKGVFNVQSIDGAAFAMRFSKRP